MQEFKIGDWVVSNHTNKICRCIKIDKLEFQDDLANWHICTSYKLWQPKEGEWCWFWNSALGIWFISTLKDFGEYNNSIQYRCNSVYYICEKCEPFIGELPSSLKDE